MCSAGKSRAFRHYRITRRLDERAIVSTMGGDVVHELTEFMAHRIIRYPKS